MEFTTYWQYSDMVTRTLFFLLLALSIISWVTGIIRVLQSRKLAANVADDLSQQVAAKQSDLTGSDAATHRLVTEQTLLKHIGRYRFASERGLPILGTTAAIAPFIGLFGTVWGIFHALHNIGTSGQAGLGQVAGPVGEALIMTGLGIAVAIPAVVFYNLAVRINRRVMYHANDRAHDLLAQSTNLAIQQPSKNDSSAAANVQSENNNLAKKDVEQPAHYHRSAHSQG
ncbi:MotA/TolQ/ExbB proton channel family protein [Psychrobacter sp. APC 3426]|uniref:MotA/TolQ/ExbB proton channel family protein n=1 Tax=Psychrobacter sp. APC 3426 TaxID=3035177 RepID=UPI0025B2FFF7|nr:MotA/TolQ/ExbB proton channel family protein [Psychrobacter sp. APC 3426]MDN3397327.1 MotA/TolQ/ExbB proton channel family protein [Psychrobacter sp. APC 3426]